jgi:hypothetical protein
MVICKEWCIIVLDFFLMYMVQRMEHILFVVFS